MSHKWEAITDDSGTYLRKLVNMNMPLVIMLDNDDFYDLMADLLNRIEELEKTAVKVAMKEDKDV